MKRSEMKANIVVQSRCRPEGRLFPRRKVAAKSQLLNGVGDFDLELSLAIQESLRYAQEKELNSEPIDCNGASDNSLEISFNPKSGHGHSRGSSTDQQQRNNKADQAMATSTSCCKSQDEVGRLKDLILTQAELIQCQQEQLHENQREIQTLKSSNDTLQCRLERMERRMSILKQKEEVQESDCVHNETNQAIGLPKSSIESTFGPTEIKRKRRLGTRHHFSQRKRRKYPRSAYLVPRQKENETNPSEEEEEEESDELTSDDSNQEHQSTKEREEEDSEEEESEAAEIDYPMLETEALYHLYYPKHIFSCLESSLTTEKLPQATQNDVETPTWRLRPLTNLYQLEGTENITDEAYFKRHQKFEMEEKRRKRWDMQRLRELRIFEKQQRQKEDEMRASQDETDVETFLPSLQDLSHIEITESLPVMAFGQPVPFVSPAEFEIPWDMSSSSQSTSRQKANSHSKRH